MADEEPKKGLEFEFGGTKLRLKSAWLAVLLPALSALGGTAWAGFQLYTRYQTMEAKINSYAAPDLSGIEKHLSVVDERMTGVERLAKMNAESLGYVTDNVSKNVANAAQTVQAIDARTRAADRDTAETTRLVLDQLRSQDRETQQRLAQTEKENQQRLKELEAGVDLKIQKTLANPLAGKE